MRDRSASMLALATGLMATLALALAASAQDPAMPQRGRNNPANQDQGNQLVLPQLPPAGQRSPDFMLLTRPAVQEELKLTEDQKRKLAQSDKARREQSSANVRLINEANQNPFAPIPQGDVEQIQEQQQQLNAEVEAAAGKILSPKQRTRLAQIGLQLDGPMAFVRDDIIEKLNLDETQQESIQEILEQSREETNGRPGTDSAPKKGNRGGGRPAPKDSPTLAADQDAVAQLQDTIGRLQKANDDARASTMQKIVRILRKKQLDTFNRLKGEPFDVAAVNDGKAKDTAKAAADSPKAVAPAPKADAKAADSAKTKTRKSLRERRGSNPDNN